VTGEITRWDVIKNAPAVVQGYGWLVLWRALFGGRPTFLACLTIPAISEDSDA
jgi:hypothetical protein